MCIRDSYKADPFANYAELRPGTASAVTTLEGFSWSDSEWIEHRAGKDMRKEPLSIYEVHMGSWRKHPQTEDNEKGFYTYREFAVEVTKYVKAMGYTHVELMGLPSIPLTVPGVIR